MSNFHVDPRELIVEAARRSGLLKEVANLIWFAEQQAAPTWCPICILLDELTDAFDAHIGMSDTVGGQVYVNGLEGGQDISPAPGTEAETEFETFYAKFCKPDQTDLKETSK